MLLSSTCSFWQKEIACIPCIPQKIGIFRLSLEARPGSGKQAQQPEQRKNQMGCLNSDLSNIIELYLLFRPKEEVELNYITKVFFLTLYPVFGVALVAVRPFQSWVLPKG